ncbi:MAG: dipeptide epimerase [Chloracidobacterium sp.]|uniref:Dipeptide epimerase n=1 Tax=Chloracidobacterium validum TaxID=2821543 RepID=A0ABX8B7P1_9BACT|nr:dipeptide epimerase [Chloracidobacterium validum]QUW02966.1 dipeptide epimerase [Chloracidobacterium validum]
MRLVARPWTLELKAPFTLAVGSRTTTPAVLVELHHGGLIGYGEVALPPYLGWTPSGVCEALSRIDWADDADPLNLDARLATAAAAVGELPPALAAVDIALHDLFGKVIGRPLYVLWGFDLARIPATSLTLGLDTPEALRRKASQATDYRILKLKLGGADDRALVQAVRDVTDRPLSVDANQGWQDRVAALDFIGWLAEQNVLFVEQPFSAARVADHAWLTERSPLPIIGDEAIRTLSDVVRAPGVYHGVNVKLAKCGGLRAAQAILTTARALGLRTLLGCMTETSCAISAAVQLSPLADWADLDGAALIAHDPFEGARLVNGRMLPQPDPGIGAHPRTSQ